MIKQPIEQIITKSKNNDMIAFQQLVEYYQSYAYSLAFRLLCSSEDAKDIVQESFIRVWKHLKKYNPKIKFTTWLYRIVVNLCYDKLKTNKRRTNIISTNYAHSELIKSISSNNTEKQIINKELIELITSFTEELTPKQKTVFVLRDLQGLEVDEIVEITKMSRGNIKSNLYYARLCIRKKLINLAIYKEEVYEM